MDTNAPKCSRCGGKGWRSEDQNPSCDVLILCVDCNGRGIPVDATN